MATGRAPLDSSLPRQRGGSFGSPTMLLALLGLAVLIAAIWYAASQRGSDPAPFDVGDVRTEPTTASPAAPAEYGAAPDPAFVDEAPAPQDAPAVPASEARRPPTPTDVAAAPTPEPPDTRTVPAEPRAPAAASSPGGTESAAATVRAFYAALSAGDGGSASQLVVPGKRGSGPLSAAALTRYYSSFRRPLRVQRVTAVDEDTVRVAYDYVLGDGRLCRGAASVNVVESGGRRLVSSIRTQGPC